MFRHLGFAAALLGAVLSAQTARITDAQRARFWRAQAELVAAQRQLERATAALQQVNTELRQACGDQQLTLNHDSGEPDCQPKPQPLKAPEVAK